MIRGARSREIEIAERNRDLTVREDATRYLRAHGVITELRNAYRSSVISPREYKDLREMALAGDVDGAVKALAKLMSEKRRA